MKEIIPLYRKKTLNGIQKSWILIAIENIILGGMDAYCPRNCNLIYILHIFKIFLFSKLFWNYAKRTLHLLLFKHLSLCNKDKTVNSCEGIESGESETEKQTNRETKNMKKKKLVKSADPKKACVTLQDPGYKKINFECVARDPSLRREGASFTRGLRTRIRKTLGSRKKILH